MKPLVVMITLLAAPAVAEETRYISTLIAGEATRHEIRVWDVIGQNQHTRSYFLTPMTFLTQRADRQSLTHADRIILRQVVPACPRGLIRDLNMHIRHDAMETTFTCRGNVPERTSGIPLPILD